MTRAIRDDNSIPVALGASSADASVTLPLTVDSATGRLLVDNAGGGSGTVTSVSVVSANGFAGTVATATTTPAITLTTSITGILEGNGTAISAASTTGSGNVVLSTSPTLVTPALGTPSTLVGTNITGTATAFTSGITNALKSATTTVNVSSATAPSSGQVLTATSSTAATWQATAGGGDMVLADVQTVTGAKTFGTIGGDVSKFILAGSTSGTTVLNAAAVAGSTTLTLPAATDTLVGRNTADTFLNKTFDLTGNTLTGTSAELATAISDETGSGLLVFNDSPTLVTPALGTPSTLVGTNITGTGASFTAGTVSTITGLAPDTATTQATQAAITSAANLVTVGTLSSGNATAIVDAASLTVAGKIEIATVAETNTGTDATRAVSPDGLDGWTGSVQVVTLGTVTTGNVDAAVSAASVTVAGKVELATTAEIDTGTDSTRAMPVDQFVASKRNIRWLTFNLVEAGTDVATATNIGGDFLSPIGGTILQSDTTPFFLYATNSTAGTTGTMVVDISIGGTSIMTTNKLDFDTTEKTTTTAATPPDLTTTTLAVGDIITIDIDAIHTTAAKGLTVYMAIRE